MTKVDPKKLGALVDKHAQKKKQPPPFGKRGGGPQQQQKGTGGDDGGDHDEPDGDEEKHELSEDEIREIGEKVQSGDGDEDLMDMTDGYDPDQDGNPPSFVGPDEEEIWNKAKKAVEPYKESYDEPWAVVAHVFKAMGGSPQGGGDDDGGDDDHGD